MGKFRIVLILVLIKLCSTGAEFVNQGSKALAQINICKEANKGDFPGSKLTIPSNFSANANGDPLEFKTLSLKKALRCKIKTDDDSGSAQNVKSDAQNQNETSSQIFFFDSGILQHKIGEMSTFYEPEDFCLVRLSDKNVEVKICISDCDPGKNNNNKKSPIAESDKQKSRQRNSGVCIRKCCPPDQVLEFKHDKTVCKNSGENRWIPTFFDSRTLNNFCISQKQTGTESQSGMNRKYRHHIQSGNLPEPNTYVIIPGLSIRLNETELVSRQSFRLLEHGGLVFENSERTPAQRFTQSRWSEIPFPFCVDGVQNIEQSGQLYSGDLRHSAILLLFGEFLEAGAEEAEPTLVSDDEDEKENETRISDYENGTDHDPFELGGHSAEQGDGPSILCVVVMYVSLVPLALTLFAYWITWATENIHGWTLFMHVLSLFVMNLLLGSTHLISVLGNVEPHSTLCIAIGALSHFFSLSTFFWLTMVNLDFWLLFRTLKPSSNRANGIRRFIGYAVFSWGGPLLIVLVGFTLDGIYGIRGSVDSDCDIILPNYGMARCYIHRDAEGVYQFFIIGILVIFNTVFFALTVSALCKFQNKSQKALKGKAKSDAAQAKLLVKLFVVMGVSFTFEFISWLVHMNRRSEDGVELGWVIVNCIIWLTRAIFIFIIFACKKKTVVELRRRCSKSRFLMSVLNKVEFSKTETEHTTQTLERSSAVKMNVLNRQKSKTDESGDRIGNSGVTAEQTL